MILIYLIQAMDLVMSERLIEVQLDSADGTQQHIYVPYVHRPVSLLSLIDDLAVTISWSSHAVHLLLPMVCLGLRIVSN